MRRTTVTLIVLALALLGFTAPANANAAMRPVKGVIVGTAVVDVAPSGTDCPLGLMTSGSAEGTVSHLGLTTMTSHHCTPAVDTITGGQMEWVAANGDKIVFTYAGKCLPPPFPALITCDTPATVTGGTGRFTHASGQVDMHVAVSFDGSYALPTILPGSWTLTGAISY
jgi:hypothetical protein